MRRSGNKEGAEMLGFMKAVAREAGRTALTYFEGMRSNEVHAKGSPKDLVSAADVAVEQLIVKRIRERFPGHGIFGEESGISNSGSEFCWIIDPIDGTQSFVKHHPFFCGFNRVLRREKTVGRGGLCSCAERSFRR